MIGTKGLRRVAEAATPGPWEWHGNTKHSFNLATSHSGKIWVMGFARMGMNGAQPVFRNDKGRLTDGRDLAIFQVNREATSAKDPSVYRHDIVGFRSPDAAYIAAANPSTILALLDELDAAHAALRKAQTVLESVLQHGRIDNSEERLNAVASIVSILAAMEDGK